MSETDVVGQIVNGTKDPTFDNAFNFTVGNEGGYSNDKYDSGGPTKFGITQHDLSVWLGRPATVDNVKEMTIETAKAIYMQRYWRPLGLDALAYAAPAICMFDIGVVRGIGIPSVYAQQICNSLGANLAVDGVMGQKTIEEINKVDQLTFVKMFSKKTRNGFLGIVARNPTQARFLKGWLRRADRLLTLV